MSDTRLDAGEQSHAFQFRHHLAIIQAQAELLLDDVGSLSTEQAASVDRIMQSCYRLDTLATTDQDTRQAPTIVPEVSTLGHIHVVTESPYLSQVIEEQPGFHDGITLECTAPADDAPAATDFVVIDAVCGDGTGLEWIAANAGDDGPPFALVSLYSDESTPVALALSGLVSPTVSEQGLSDALAAFTDEPTTEPIAGFLDTPPATPLLSRIEAHPDSTIGDTAAAVEAATAGTEASVVALSPNIYHQLTPRQLGALRTVGPGRGRPVILVTDTGADPYDREWVPTLGSRQFLHLPPDLVGLIAQLYARQPRTALDTPR